MCNTQSQFIDYCNIFCVEVWVLLIVPYTLTSQLMPDAVISVDGWFCENSPVGGLVASDLLYKITLLDFGVILSGVHAVVVLLCTPLLLTHVLCAARTRRRLRKCACARTASV